MTTQIPTHGEVNRELQSALDYACALGRMAGGHGPEVVWNVGSQSRKQKAENGNGTLAEIKLQALRNAMNQAHGNKAEAARILGIRRCTVHDMLKRAGWVLSAFCFLVSALLVGCATPNAGTTKAAQQRRPTGPPMPPMPMASAERNTRAVAMTATAPQPPRRATITLAWDKNEPDALTQVWSGPTIFNRTVWHKTNVMGSIVTLPCDQPAEFYRIRNQVGEQVSRWHDE